MRTLCFFLRAEILSTRANSANDGALWTGNESQRPRSFREGTGNSTYHGRNGDKWIEGKKGDCCTDGTSGKT